MLDLLAFDVLDTFETADAEMSLLFLLTTFPFFKVGETLNYTTWASVFPVSSSSADS